MKTPSWLATRGWLVLLGLWLGVTPGANSQDIRDKASLEEHYRLAERLKKEGKLKEATDAYERIVKAAPAILKPDSQDTATLTSNLASLYQDLVRYPEAEPRYRQALQIFERQLGENHPNVGVVLDKLSRLYREMGQLKDSEAHYQRALQIREARQAEEPLPLALTLNDLALLYREMARYTEAEHLFRRSIQIHEANPGKDNVSLATSLDNLAELHQELGRYQDAEAGFRRALQIRQESQGPDHPSIAQSLNYLGLLDQELGDYKRAGERLHRALQIREDTLGKDHLDVAQSLNNLAYLDQALGQFQEAEEFYHRSLQIREAKLGKDHPLVAQSLNNLAWLYWNLGRYHEAEPLYNRSQKIRETKLGNDHPAVAQSLNNRTLLFIQTGRLAEARPLCLRALQIRQDRLGKDHPDVAQSLINRALLEKYLGQYTEAEQHNQSAIQIARTRLGKDHHSVARGLENLAEVYWYMGRFQEAETLYLDALQVFEKLGPEHPLVANCLDNLAQIYQDMGKDKEAELHSRRALQVREKKLGRDHPYLILNLDKVAQMCTRTGRYQEAETLYRRALQICDARLNQDHHFVGQILHDLAVLYQTQGRYQDAEPLCRRSLQIRRTTLGREHPDVAQSLSTLAALAEATRQTDQAVQLAEDARRISRRHVAQVLPALSENEQITFLRFKDQPDWHAALSLALRHPGDPRLAERSAAWLLNGKGVAHEALAQRILLARDSRDPRLGELTRQLIQVRQELAHLTLPLAFGGQEEQRQRLEQLGREEQELTRQLRQSGSTFIRDDLWIEPDQVRQRIKGDTVLIEIVRFQVLDFPVRGQPKEGTATNYAAWIIPAAGQGAVRVIDLGEAGPIDQAVQAVRRSLAASPDTILTKGEPEAEGLLRQPLQALAQLVLHPLLSHIGKTQRRWIISPDGPLWLAPWSALPLPDGRYAVEQYTLCHVISGRDLIHRPSSIKPTDPLVFADPNFDLSLDEADKIAQDLLGDRRRDVEASLAGRRANGQLGKWKIHVEFQANHSLVIRDGDEKGAIIGRGRWQLEGNTVRAETEKSRYLGHLQGRELTGERRFKDNSSSPEKWTLVLDRAAPSSPDRNLAMRSSLAMPRAERLDSTAKEAWQIEPALRTYTGMKPHLFLDNQALSAVVQAARNPRILVLSTHGRFLDDQSSNSEGKPAVRIENPLLRCFLVLAGFNNAAKARKGQDNGVLTGLQIVGTDLRGCELVVLSACETGLGDVRNGEGVAGLRQAFQLAGAESVIATLWKVPDEDSADLMITFFARLAAKQSKPDALCQAQRAIIKAHQDKKASAHPFFWAAYTITGRMD